MPYIIDSHQDLAFNMLTFGRDYRRSVAETRQLEQDTPIITQNGHTLLGWPDYQAGQVAVIFATLFFAPKRYQAGEWDTQVFSNFDEAYRLARRQVDCYNALCDQSPDQFTRILNRHDLAAVMTPWETQPANPPKITHPVGLVTLMEGLEGVRHPDEMAEWWEAGVRVAGMVWAGTRLCGGTQEGDRFTREGQEFLEVMADIGFTLDISHMNDVSAQFALDAYQGPVVATHANVRALLNETSRRHLSDAAIHKLIERDGVMGIVPFNRFLKPNWSSTDKRGDVTLAHVAAHIDYVCQLAGNAAHVAIGTDFDGGFGWPAVPAEVDTISDLQKLVPLLAARGYSGADIAAIMGGNWRRVLERILPE